jgi:hypothetical protein
MSDQPSADHPAQGRAPARPVAEPRQASAPSAPRPRKLECSETAAEPASRGRSTGVRPPDREHR